MKKVRLIPIVLLAMTTGIGAAQAIEVDGKKGLGYAAAIGGAQGLAFNYGVGNLIIEGILGLDYASYSVGDTDFSAFGVNLGVGAHFAALRAEQAAWTIGARFNLGYGGVGPQGGPFAPDPEDAEEVQTVTQFGFDIPTRVYWFPNKHFSIHTEFGIAIKIGPEDGVLFPGVVADGLAVEIFDNGLAGLVGGAGATFWW